MKVMVAGCDGYLGWPLTLRLIEKGHDVLGVDNGLRRRLVRGVGSSSAFLLPSFRSRKEIITSRGGRITHADILFRNRFSEIVGDFKPDAIVNYAHIPSAPFSMISFDTAKRTVQNNVLGMLSVLFAMRNHVPDAQLVTLGTMGEYGTPDVPIPEGFFENHFRGRSDRMMFPRCPGSWYHSTKVFMSHLFWFAHRNWGLKGTDIMQGVVLGTWLPEMGDDPTLRTRFDYDECFGTVVNRFVVESILGMDLTPYGKGYQKRGYIALRDSIQCVEIALENPVDDYRIWNQYDECYTVNELADMVAEVGEDFGIETEVQHVKNPRIEAEEHYYNPDRETLPSLGFKPTLSVKEEIHRMFEDLIPCKGNFIKEAIAPKTKWASCR